MPALTLGQRVHRNARSKGVTILTRRQWGSTSRATYLWRLANRRVASGPADTLVQHITVTSNSPTLSESMRTLESIGNSRFGSGVSYNFAVDMVTGHVGEGQPLKAGGTHTVNEKNVPGYSYDQNHVARAIAVIGMEDDELSPKAEAAIVKLIAALIEEKAITPGHDYVPHSLFAAKSCPCDSTRDKMPRINKQARELAAKGN